MRCSELVSILESFGFVCTVRNRGNHHTVTHSHSVMREAGFITAGFDGGHGRNPAVLPNYINDMRSLLNQYRDALQEIGYD